MRRAVQACPTWVRRAALGGAVLLAVGLAGAETPDAAKLAEGKVLFQTKSEPACAVCHTLKDAEATGPIGPDLDELKPSREQIRAVLRDGSGPMPSYDGKLSKEQVELVINYVYWATHPQ